MVVVGLPDFENLLDHFVRRIPLCVAPVAVRSVTAQSQRMGLRQVGAIPAPQGQAANPLLANRYGSGVEAPALSALTSIDRGIWRCHRIDVRYEDGCAIVQAQQHGGGIEHE